MLMQHICIFMYIKYTLIIVILWDTLQKTYKIHMITYNYSNCLTTYASASTHGAKIIEVDSMQWGLKSCLSMHSPQKTILQTRGNHSRTSWGPEGPVIIQPSRANMDESETNPSV